MTHTGKQALQYVLTGILNYTERMGGDPNNVMIATNTIRSIDSYVTDLEKQNAEMREALECACCIIPINEDEIMNGPPKRIVEAIKRDTGKDINSEQGKNWFLEKSALVHNALKSTRGGE